MNEKATSAPGVDQAAVTTEGELLSRIHRRLVPLHLGLATADAVDRDFQRKLMHELMGVLREIAENPQFRAAADAEHERWRVNPTPEEKAAQERSQAIVERWRRARAERLAREGANTSGE